jgi:hypothetical protein
LRVAILIFLLTLPGIMATSFGTVGGKVGRVIVYGDSLNNDRELEAKLVEILGIGPEDLWMAAHPGAKAHESAADVTANRVCTSGLGYPPEWCRSGFRQTGRVDGVCRSYANMSADLPSNGLGPAVVCQGAAVAGLEACTGVGTGTTTMTCLADLPVAPNDIVVLAFGSNDVSEPSPGGGVVTGQDWCDDALGLFTSFKADYVAMADDVVAAGLRAVVVTPPYILSDYWITDNRETATECIRDYLHDELLPLYPTFGFVDGQDAWDNYETSRGTAAMLKLYHDCPSIGAASATYDCTHPGWVDNGLGFLGKDFLSEKVGRMIEAMVGRR